MNMPEGWEDLDQINHDFHTGRIARIDEALDLMKEMADALYKIGERDDSQNASALKAHVANTALQKFLEWK